MNRVELKKPTKNDMGLVLDHIANKRTVRAVYRGQYVTIKSASIEAVTIETYDNEEGFLVDKPVKRESIKLVFDWQRELRTGF